MFAWLGELAEVRYSGRTQSGEHGMTLSEKVREAAQDVMVATEAPLSNTLNRFVEAFIGWPFAIRPAIIEGLDGSRSAPFAAVVYMVPGGAAVPDIRPVPADRAAALIDACEA